jgi:hypothetical protein
LISYFVNNLPVGLCGLVIITTLVFGVIDYSNALKLNNHSPDYEVIIGAVTILAPANSI